MNLHFSDPMAKKNSKVLFKVKRRERAGGNSISICEKCVLAHTLFSLSRKRENTLCAGALGREKSTARLFLWIRYL